MTDLPPREEPGADRRRPGLFARLRGNFLTGLVVVLPIGLTLWLIWTVTGWIDGWVLPLIPHRFRPDNYIGVDPRGAGVLIFLIFTIAAGWLAKGLLGRTAIHWGERLVARMPVIRSIYNGLKQIAETVFAQSETSFNKACLVEYPRKGLWAIGFISTSAKGEIAARLPLEGKAVSVFVPTTPNPTSGFLLYVTQSEVIELEMSIEDAAKLIISAGLVYPTEKAARGAAEAIAAGNRQPGTTRRAH